MVYLHEESEGKSMNEKRTTIRVHINPKDALGSLEHVRSKDFRNKEKHVVATGACEVWLDKPVYDVYSELFGKALTEYNEKQKRKDRRILNADGDAVAASCAVPARSAAPRYPRGSPR